MTELKINLLGKIEFQYGVNPLEHKLSNKGIALISLLMLNVGKEASRDKLISYLWADSDEDAARYNLRFNLWNIRKLIPTDQYGQELVITHKDYCLINPKYDFSSDMLILRDFFESKEKERSLEELIEFKEMFRGDFLEGIYLKNCDEFNEKIIFERIVYQNRYVELLNEIACKYEASQNYNECIRILNELIGIEPYNERTIYRLVSVYNSWGKRFEAINCYKKFETLLRSNLNIAPGQDLKRLYQKLLEEPKESSRESSAEEKIQKQIMSIEVQCIKNVDFFCVADIIRKIILKGDRKYIFGFSKCYLEDLNYIQLEVGLVYEKLYTDKCALHASLPGVRIADAFIKFVRYVCEVYDLQIRILNPADMDPISLNLMDHLKRLEIEALIWKE